MKVCLVSGCPRAAVRNGRCAVHAKDRDRTRQRAHWRSGGSTPAQRRAEFARADGLCQSCGEPTPLNVGIREHLRAVADGGTDSQDNTAWFCRPCADRKTAAARANGLSG